MLPARKIVLWLLVSLSAVSLACSAIAEPMHFEAESTGGNHCCWWIQATGEISQDTATSFESFFKGTRFAPRVVRLNSPGGSLIGGILLGQKFRELSVSTEVGSSRLAASPQGPEPGYYSTAPGICASACAYAYLGGVDRTLDEGSKLGFHRFYTQGELASSTNKIFSGKDLDDTQRTVAALLLYVVSMGVDGRLVALASQAGPDEVHWLQPDEARDLRVVYEPETFKPWRLEPYKDGAIAVSQSNDGLRSVVAACSLKNGPYVALIDRSPDVDEQWLKQCGGAGTVFGVHVQPNDVSLSRGNGAVTMRFHLPTRNPPLTSPKLFSFDIGYSMVCSTGSYQASRVNFRPVVRLALRNCYD